MKPAATLKPTLTPKLRFPEFRDAPGWAESVLRALADPVSERAENDDENNILTLSGEQGLVLQSEYFGKKIAGTNAERYLRIQQDDFVYNDRVTKASAYGTIKRLKKHRNGIVSPIYKCFRFKAGELPGFWEWYFEAGAHEAQLRSLANEGARAGRFNVSIGRFLSTSVWAPDSTNQEQHKIASCLSSLDDLIGAESQKLDALKAHKKGLMQQLFPREGETRPRLRFPEFRDAGKWTSKPMGKVYSFKGNNSLSRDQLNYENGSVKNIHYGDIHTKFSTLFDITRERVPFINHTVSLDGFLPENDCVEGDMIFADASEDLEDIGKSIEVVRLSGERVVSGQHTILARPNDNVLVVGFGAYLFKSKHVRTQIQKESQGTKVLGISAKRLINIILSIPSTKDEQHSIATCLASLDDLITAQSVKVETLKTHKKGLIQQLFPYPSEAEA